MLSFAEMLAGCAPSAPANAGRVVSHDDPVEAEFAPCRKCGREYSEDAFYGRVRGGKWRPLTICKDCHKRSVYHTRKKRP